MCGFILEISLNYVQFHQKKYTLSSAKHLISHILLIKPPKRRSVLVNIAFSEFYTLSGFLNSDPNLLNVSIEFLKEIFRSLGIDFDTQILASLDRPALDNLGIKDADILKYALKNITLSYFYLHKIDSKN